MIELAVLGVLRGSELHGYELKKRLGDVLDPRSSVSFGSLYPALNRLEAAGLVKAVTGAAPVPAGPMTGSFGGELAAFRAARRRTSRGPRNRKVYGITDRGESRLAELLAEGADDERSFPVKVALFRWCDPATRVSLLERRRATLEARLAAGRRSAGVEGDRYVRARREHDTESTEREIAWLDRLLQPERDALSEGPARTDPEPPQPGGPQR